MDGSDVLAWATAIIGVIGTILGATWWLATVHATVKRTEGEVKKSHQCLDGVRTMVVELDRTVRDHAAHCDLERIDLIKRVDDHENRLRNLE